MKTNLKISYVASVVLACAAMQSCSVEHPFGNAEGVLMMNVRVDSDVTRAQLDDAELADKCVVYISNDKGLIRKYEGLSNLPSQEVLKQGSYVAEAWTGDSVPASFDSRFFRGFKTFEIQGGHNNEVNLTCKIVNSVVSINASTIEPALMKDFNINVASSNGQLDFTEDNYRDAKGYFMLPYKDGARESVLNVTVTGVNAEGRSFSKTHVIEGVKPAYEYEINISFNPLEPEEQGGGFIQISVIEKENQIKDTVAIFAAPLVQGSGFDIDKQQYAEPGEFTKDLVINIIAFNEINAFEMSSEDYVALGFPLRLVDLHNTTTQIKADYNHIGITWDVDVTNVEGYDGVTRQSSNLTFSKNFLNSLPARDKEYVITFECSDGFGKVRSKTLRLAVGSDAVIEEDPIVANDAVDPTNLMAIGARKATLTATIKDEAAENTGIRYREVGTEEWTVVPVSAQTRAGTKVSVTINNLKPGTRYEYQAVADGFYSDSKYFTTEGIFVIPNASLEEWGVYSANKNVILPGADGECTFWDSGNHGSATMNVTLTQGSTDMVHSGTQSACLRSKFVGLGALGKFAAGNLFAGEYYKTNGTNGEIYFGRDYNSSHPSALKVFVNYRPGTADKNGSKGGKLKLGDLDKGQIYVALTTEKIHIDTRYPDTMLWNTDAPAVLAYGEKIFNENFGPDGQLQELTIPIKYKSSAKSLKPLYLVIVCTASYYGDYFDGGEGSTMYVDDFELIYE